MINLVIAPTGSGKTEAFVTRFPRDRNIAVVAPFTSLTEQIFLANPDFEIKKGLKAQEGISFSNGMITSFHSSQRLLEMDNIDMLVIDELHYLVNYAGFTFGMLNTFWDTISKLRKKFPNMIVVALTATPHFIRLANFIDFEIINITQSNPTAKPSEIFVGTGWQKEFGKDNSFITLYPSQKIGQGWAQKFGGTYIDSQMKEKSLEYEQIILGKMPTKKVFTSPLLATGVSILDPVDWVYTNWLDLTDIVQMSARPRQGEHKLGVTRTPNPYFLKDGMDKPKLNFGNDFESNLKLINEYSTWYSWIAHQDANDLFAVLYQMIWLPSDELPKLDY